MSGTVYIGLLRAVNVGGANRVAMAELRALAERIGLENVRTYIQSGNLVFEARNTASHWEGRLNAAIAQEFGIDVHVMCRSATELASIIGGLPEPMMGHEPRHLYVAFLQHTAGPEAAVDPDRSPVDRIVIGRREAYVAYADGIGRSKLGAAYLERALGQPLTMRNWNTVTRLAAMTEDR